MGVEYYHIMCMVVCRLKCPLYLTHNKMGERDVRGSVMAYL